MMKAILFSASMLALAAPATVSAQPGNAGSPPAQQPSESTMAAVGSHIRALEESGNRPLEAVLTEFESERFAESYLAATTAADRQALITRVRTIASNAGGSMARPEGDDIVLTLRGEKEHEIRFRIEPDAPHRITQIDIVELAPPNPITRETLESRIDEFMADGNKSGLVHIRLDGEQVLEKAYGMANPELGTPITGDTVFGIGSRPIDFTIAAILLLSEQGKLALDDSLADHFENVPPDRAGMTILHMVNGRSGLPDFPANKSDADPDLAWIDRDEFIRRTMAAPLKFAPGEGRAHSHWAFGVLAAIVEKASGKTYSEYLRENFFDPAGMTRTGDNGETRGLALDDFAVGGGRQVGLPNIPPNWGPTSWLVLGSGGMFSTLNDLRKFYSYVIESSILPPRRAALFQREQVNVDGSERGFELLSISADQRRDEAWMFVNDGTKPGMFDPIVRPLLDLMKEE